jgi:hypothetical protein
MFTRIIARTIYDLILIHRVVTGPPRPRHAVVNRKGRPAYAVKLVPHRAGCTATHCLGCGQSVVVGKVV